MKVKRITEVEELKKVLEMGGKIYREYGINEDKFADLYNDGAEKNPVKRFMTALVEMINKNFQPKDITVQLDDPKKNTLRVKYMNHDEFILEVKKA